MFTKLITSVCSLFTVTINPTFCYHYHYLHILLIIAGILKIPHVASLAITVNLCKTATQKKTKIGFQDQLSLNAVKSIAECSKGSILQYFWPALSYHLSLRSLFCLFLSGRFTQGLLCACQKENNKATDQTVDAGLSLCCPNVAKSGFLAVGPISTCVN